MPGRPNPGAGLAPALTFRTDLEWRSGRWAGAIPGRADLGVGVWLNVDGADDVGAAILVPRSGQILAVSRPDAGEQSTRGPAGPCNHVFCVRTKKRRSVLRAPLRNDSGPTANPVIKAGGAGAGISFGGFRPATHPDGRRKILFATRRPLESLDRSFPARPESKAGRSLAW